MLTPYDALLRLRQREMDDMRVAINLQVNQLIYIENRQTVVNAAFASAQQTASEDVLLSTQAYMARIRGERDALLNDKAMIRVRLDKLRANAMEAYGSLRAARSAAEDYRGEREKDIANADQLFIDDLTASRHRRSTSSSRQ